MLIDKMKTEITRFTWDATKDFGVDDTSHVVSIPIWGSDYVIGIYGRVKTAFAGITGPVTMKIGNSTDDDCIMFEANLANVGELYIHMLTDSHWICKTDNRDARYDYLPPLITFTSSSGNLSGLTAGEVEIVVIHIVPDK